MLITDTIMRYTLICVYLSPSASPYYIFAEQNISTSEPRMKTHCADAWHAPQTLTNDLPSLLWIACKCWSSGWIKNYSFKAVRCTHFVCPQHNWLQVMTDSNQNTRPRVGRMIWMQKWVMKWNILSSDNRLTHHWPTND